MSATCSSTDLLDRLVSFDTTSHKSNLELIEFVADYFEGYGIDCVLIKDEAQAKANLYATVGRPDRPGIMLSGHTDVVPVEGQQWSSDPFTLTRKESALYGRGTADMKGFIASALALLPSLVERPLVTPVHYALSYDEEVGCLGVRHLIEMVRELETRPAMAIIGEPTEMGPVVGHKGKRAFFVKVRGKAGHSAYTSSAVNAVEYAARLITHIHSIQRRKSSEGPFDHGYQVPHTTLHTGTITGGTALNIVPESCDFTFEVRNIPMDEPQAVIDSITDCSERLIEEMQAIDSRSDIEFSEITNYPGLNTDPNAEVTRFVQQLLDETKPVDRVSFGTEAGLFSESLNIPSVVCGPGNIAQAHKADEFISIDQLDHCDRMMHRLAQRCLHPL